MFWLIITIIFIALNARSLLANWRIYQYQRDHQQDTKKVLFWMAVSVFCIVVMAYPILREVNLV